MIVHPDILWLKLAEEEALNGFQMATDHWYVACGIHKEAQKSKNTKKYKNTGGLNGFGMAADHWHVEFMKGDLSWALNRLSSAGGYSTSSVWETNMEMMTTLAIHTPGQERKYKKSKNAEK